MKIFRHLFLILVLLSASSCVEQVSTLYEFVHFTRRIIQIPDCLHVVENGKISLAELCVNRPILIIYHDSLSCGLCAVNKMDDRQKVYDLSDSLGTFEVMTIFAPREDEYEAIVKEFILRDYDFPIYIDPFRDFSKLNSLPDDKRFHSFLIDKSRNPIFVGNPNDDKRHWDLFNDVLRIIL